MPPSPQPSWCRLTLRFAFGLFWFALLAALFSSLTNSSFFVMLAALVVGALFTAGLALIWMARWAMRDDARPNQFSIGSLLFLTAFVAIYFAAVRWLVSHIPGIPLHSYQNPLQHYRDAFPVLAVAIFCLVFALLSTPIVFGMLDVLLRLAVWSLSFAPIRWLLKLLFHRKR